MAVLTEGDVLSDVLLFEGQNTISRTILNTTEAIGTVVNAAGAKVTADGKDDPVGVVVGDNMVVDHHAIVAKDRLIFPASMSVTNKDNYLFKLLKMGVKAR